MLHITTLSGAGIGASSSSYSCSMSGVCTATSAAQAAIFMRLQQQLNRVRSMFGLPADVVTDGKIGAKTAAKLIRLAEQVEARLGSGADRIMTYYAVTTPEPTASRVASEALAIVQALERNGMSAAAWSVQDDSPVPAGAMPNPYVQPAHPPVITAQSLLPAWFHQYLTPSATNTPAAPTASTPTPVVVSTGPAVSATPGITAITPRGLKIGAMVGGLALAGGIIAAIVKSRS